MFWGEWPFSNPIAIALLLITFGLLIYIGPFLPSITLWPALVWNILFPRRNSRRAKTLNYVLSSLAADATVASRIEIVVVDGGSQDDTMQAIQETTDSSIEKKGASLARGKVLLFCHADTRLPRGYDTIICAALEDPDVWLTAPLKWWTCVRMARTHTAFSFGIERETGAHRADFDFVERGANVRSRLLSLPYGDQALALRAATYRAVGGLKPYSMMEDFEFVCRIRARALASGGRVLILPQTARCSARRWDRVGAYKNTFLNWFFVFLYWLGVGPDAIFRLYYRG